MFEYMTVRELYEMVNLGSSMEIDTLEYVELDGWIRTNRDNGKVGFIELNDGTYFRNAQLVYKPELSNFDEVTHYTTGSSIRVVGKLKITPEGKQPFEVEVTEMELLGACDHDYPY